MITVDVVTLLVWAGGAIAVVYGLAALGRRFPDRPPVDGRLVDLPGTEVRLRGWLTDGLRKTWREMRG